MPTILELTFAIILMFVYSVTDCPDENIEVNTDHGKRGKNLSRSIGRIPFIIRDTDEARITKVADTQNCKCLSNFCMLRFVASSQLLYTTVVYID